MATQKIEFLSPVGRLVMGSLYDAQTTDQDGKPLVVKTGANAGQPTQRYFFALAVPKQPGHSHWAYTDWGAKILAVGRAAFPQGQAERPDFAWKIVDGDSTIPNKKGNKPCDREGYPGHWVISFSSSYAPKIVNKDGSAPIIEPGAVKIGYFAQVLGTVDGNGQAMTPGVYINHSIVSMQGYGPEISMGPDPKTVGFGQQPLPPGASATPLPGMSAPPAAGGYPPGGQPPAPAGAGTPPPPGAGVQIGAGAPPPPTAVQPHASFLHAGGVPPAGAGAPPPPAAAAVPPPPPAAAAIPPAAPKVMLPAAGGASYESFIQQGWNDAQMIAAGYMAP